MVPPPPTATHWEPVEVTLSKGMVMPEGFLAQACASAEA
jgi:hypothetical protein